MEPLEFLLGIVTFNIAVKLKKPIRKAAVMTACQVLGILEGIKTASYCFKEEMEDIVAEAQYENMRRNIKISPESETKTENENNNEGGM